VGVIVQRDDGRGPAVNWNNSDGWSSDGMVLRPGGGKMETQLSGGESDQEREDLFYSSGE
jgi:hypothetical protein